MFAGFNSTLPLYGKPVHLDMAKIDDTAEIIRTLHPELIIHAAALTDVDQCEQQPELAELVNGIATGAIGKAASKMGTHVTYVSTDYVFSGEEGNYDESARPNPLNHYGRSKLMGEKLLIETGVNYCIARPSVIYGWGRPEKPNFALFVVKALEEKRKVKAAYDLYCSPTLNINLAEMLLELSTRQLTGTFHASGATRTSRIEFARDIAEEFALNPEEISPVDSRTFNWQAKRPSDSSLNVDKAARTLNAKPMKLPNALQLFHTSRPSTTQRERQF
jgi:dTDP-4-dehydrorhamnose reductase